MTAVNKTWLPWFGQPVDKPVEDDSSEAARAILTAKTPQEQIDALKLDIDATLETFKQELLEAQKQQFEALVDAWTAPEASKEVAQSASKSVDENQHSLQPTLEGDAKNLHWILSAASKRLGRSQAIKKFLSLYQREFGYTFAAYSTVSDFIHKPIRWKDKSGWYTALKSLRCQQAIPIAFELLNMSERIRYRELFGELTVQTPTTSSQQLSFDGIPPKPEITGDYQRVRWILQRLKRRFSFVQVTKRINKDLRELNEDAISPNAISALAGRVYGYHKARGGWYPPVKSERLPSLIEISYGLLTPSEQTQYDEMFGEPFVKKSDVVTQQVPLDSAPPKPEITGDYKRLNWLLKRLKRRFRVAEITQHLNVVVKKHNELTFSSQTLGLLAGKVFQYNSEAGKWYPSAKAERLPTAIKAAYQLLTSAEQAQYNEMFGAPKS